MTPPVISPTGGWFGTLLFVLLFVAALILFGIRVGQLITLLLKARRENRTDHIDDRGIHHYPVRPAQFDAWSL